MILDWDGNVLTAATKQDGKLVIENRQDCSRVLDFMGHCRNEMLNDLPGVGRLQAKIPHVTLQGWLDEAGIGWHEFFQWPKKDRMAFYKRHLDDPDWKNLKATTRRLK